LGVGDCLLMKKHTRLLLLIPFLFFIGCAGLENPFFGDRYVQIEKSGAKDVDLDDNGAMDQAFGGTNASSAAAARTLLGLAIGSDIQQWDADLDIYASISPSSDIQALMGAASTASFLSILGAEPADVTILKQSDVDDTPANGVTGSPVSSNWAYDAAVLIAANDTEKADKAGAVYTGIHDAGGATSWEIPNGENPSVTVAGQISNDTDGANVIYDLIEDNIVRAYTDPTVTGVSQYPVTALFNHFDLTFSTSGVESLWQPWRNRSGMDAHIVRIGIRTDDNGLVVDVDEYTGFTSTTILNQVVNADITCDAAGTNIYTKAVEYDDIDHPVIESGHGLSFDFDGAASGTIEITVIYDAAVN